MLLFPKNKFAWARWNFPELVEIVSCFAYVLMMCLPDKAVCAWWETAISLGTSQNRMAPLQGSGMPLVAGSASTKDQEMM